MTTSFQKGFGERWSPGITRSVRPPRASRGPHSPRAFVLIPPRDKLWLSFLFFFLRTHQSSVRRAHTHTDTNTDTETDTNTNTDTDTNTNAKRTAQSAKCKTQMQTQAQTQTQTETVTEIQQHIYIYIYICTPPPMDPGFTAFWGWQI